MSFTFLIIIIKLDAGNGLEIWAESSFPSRSVVSRYLSRPPDGPTADAVYHIARAPYYGDFRLVNEHNPSMSHASKQVCFVLQGYTVCDACSESRRECPGLRWSAPALLKRVQRAAARIIDGDELLDRPIPEAETPEAPVLTAFGSENRMPAVSSPVSSTYFTFTRVGWPFYLSKTKYDPEGDTS